MKRFYDKKGLNQLARKIIETNQYVAVATSDKKGSPWISPVVYAYDKSWNLYFTSLPASKHCKNIKTTNNVAYAIFDSRQLSGEGVGIQAEGVSEEVSFKNYPKVANILFKRDYPYGKITPKMAAFYIKKALKRKGLYKFYKITPKVVWINNPNSKVDVRVKVNLNG